MAQVKALIDGVWQDNLCEDENVRVRLSESRGFRGKVEGEGIASGCDRVDATLWTDGCYSSNS